MTEQRRIVYSVSLSAGLWGLLTALSLLVPLHTSPPIERAYTDVAIRLDASPSARAEAAAPAVPDPQPQALSPQPVPQQQSAPAEPSPARQTPPPAALSPPPAVPQPQVPAPQQSVPQQLAPDFSGGAFPPSTPRTETARPRPEWPDDGEFAEFRGGSTSAGSSAAVGNPAEAPQENTFSGTAAAAASGQDTGAAVTASGQRSDTSESLNSISAALDRITGTYTSRGASGGVSYETALNAGSSVTGDSETALAAVGPDGQKRRLRHPNDPVITLSAESEALIGSSIKVSITIRVLPTGNIQPGGITFTPESLLPPRIRAEIIEQIAQWRFDPGETDGQAAFEYSIKKE